MADYRAAESPTRRSSPQRHSCNTTGARWPWGPEA